MFGQQDYSMRIWVDPDQLAARSLTAMDVVAAVSEQNIQVAAGQIGQPPTSRPAKQRTSSPLTTLGRLSEPEQFEDIVLRTDAGRPQGPHQGLGRAEIGAKNQDVSEQARRPARRPASAIFQLPDANALDTADRIRAKMEELKKHFPAGPRLRDRLRHHAVHPRVDRRGGQDADRGDRPGGHRRADLPAELASTIIPLMAVPVAIIGTFAVMAVMASA